MLAKKPQDRYQTPAEVAAAFEPYCGLPAAFSSTQVRTIPVPAVPVARTSPHAYINADPSTDSQFRLPPPTPAAPRRKKPNPNRWYGPIAIGVGLFVLGLLVLAIYAITRSKPESGPPLDSHVKLTFPSHSEMELVLIRPGSFAMGSPESEEGHQPDEGPVHEVELTKPFYMGTTEVTIRQYHAVTGRYPRSFVATLPKVEKEEIAPHRKSSGRRSRQRHYGH